MIPTVIKTCPSADNDFEPLSEYQAQTPQTFFDGKPVLYYHDEKVKAWVSKEQFERLYFFSKSHNDDDAAIASPSPPECYALENDGGKHLREEERIEVFVGSHKLILFSHNSGTGIEIPYPSITLHAIKNFRHREKPDDEDFKFIGVYMQLEFSDSSNNDGDDDEPLDPIELTLIPSSSKKEDHPTTTTIDPLNTERTTALFNQISACSNLHPDPREEGDENEDDYDDEDDAADRIVFEGDGEYEHEPLEGFTGVMRGSSSNANGNGVGLPPPMPGSSGWITADNVNEYFDQDGNWIGGGGGDGGDGDVGWVMSGQLGEGAGRARAHGEVDGDGDDNDANGGGGEGSKNDGDSKRARTE